MQTLKARVIPRTSDIGNLKVKRALPSREQRSVGSFVFWDQFGPGELLRDVGLDVRPHPHIGLSTLSYLFQGSIQHRDSLKNNAVLNPGGVHLMTAGSGIMHSERSDIVSRQNVTRLFGIQSWLALPRASEEMDPAFESYSQELLPIFTDRGVSGRVLLGDWGGLKSPVNFHSDSIYVDLLLEPGGRCSFPGNYEERAIFSVYGPVELDGVTYNASELLVLAPKRDVQIFAPEGARVLVFGGEPLDGPRHVWWNFVSSDLDRIEQAKHDWADGHFGQIPGDGEFIPLPDQADL